MQELVSGKKNLCVQRITGTETRPKAKLAVNALDGAKVQEVVSTIHASPPAVVERAKLISD